MVSLNGRPMIALSVFSETTPLRVENAGVSESVAGRVEASSGGSLTAVAADNHLRAAREPQGEVRIHHMFSVHETCLPDATAPREQRTEEGRRALAQKEANIVGDEEDVDELTSTRVYAKVCQREFSFIPN